MLYGCLYFCTNIWTTRSNWNWITLIQLKSLVKQLSMTSSHWAAWNLTKAWLKLLQYTHNHWRIIPKRLNNDAKIKIHLKPLNHWSRVRNLSIPWWGHVKLNPTIINQIKLNFLLNNSNSSWIKWYKTITWTIIPGKICNLTFYFS